MRTLEATPLEGTLVRLEPLRLDHVDALHAAASEARDSYAVTTVPRDAAGMRAYVEFAVAEAERGRAVPFVTLDKRSGRVVGSTRFANLEWWSWASQPPPPLPVGPDALEIGWTWLAASAQHTGVNTEAKLLMLDLAFGGWRVRRVTLKTDARNARSRAAMTRIGATFEGTLRAHMPAADGGVRDSAMFSFVASEWPEKRAALAAKLRLP